MAYPENEGLGGNTTNNYRPGEPGSNGDDAESTARPQVNNKDHLTLVTFDLNSYVFGSFYGGHPTPIRGQSGGRAGLFTRGLAFLRTPETPTATAYVDDWFRTIPYDPFALRRRSRPACAPSPRTGPRFLSPNGEPDRGRFPQPRRQPTPMAPSMMLISDLEQQH